VDLYPQII